MPKKIARVSVSRIGAERPTHDHSMDDKAKELEALLKEIEELKDDIEIAQMDTVAHIERLRLTQNKERS